MKQYTLSITLLCLLLSTSLFGDSDGKTSTHTSFTTNPKRKPLSTLESAATAPALEEKEPEIYLNFENASLDSVLDYLKTRLKLDVIPHKDLKNVKGSLTSRKPMSLTEAWQALLILLEANGYGIATVNGITQVLAVQNIGKNPLPHFSSAKGTEPEDLKDSNDMIRYIYFCRNIKVNIAQGILGPLLAEGSVQTNNALQACIITERSVNIKSAMQIVKELDTGGLRQAIKIKALQHTSAQHITRLFNEHIIQQDNQQNGRIRIISNTKEKDASFFSKDTKIIPEPIHNKLILMGTNDAIDRIIDFIDKYLDVPLNNARSRLHVKELKYVAAEKIKAILDQIIQPPKGQGGDQGTTEGNYRFFKDVIITATNPDTSEENGQGRGFGNRLVISCGDDDWIRLRSFIDKLDKMQPQVAMEIMIVDIKNDGTRSLGAQLRSKDNVLGKNIAGASFMLPSATAQLGQTNLITDIRGTESESPLSPHSTILSFGDASKNDIWGAIRAAYKIDNTNIISQPYLVANNNSTCEENVTSSRKIPGKLESSNSTVATGLYRRIEDVDANIKTVITPRINASGIIELAIDIEVSEFKEASTTSADKTDRHLTTRASMAAGEVLVLGGLTSSKHDNTRWEVPILGSLPLIGNLFRDRTKTNVKKNLYIFIRPTVLKPHFGLGADDYTQLKLDYAKFQVLSHDDYATNKDPIQRYFFAPRRYGIKNKLSDLAANRMPILDGFSERKNMPGEVQIDKDPYYHDVPGSDEKEPEETYTPESADISMPHLNPANYVSPGLLEESLSAEVMAEVQQELARSANPTMPLPFTNMQKRGPVI